MLLVERGDLDGLRARADAGDEYATRELAGLLAEVRAGDLDEAGRRSCGAPGRIAGLADESTPPGNWPICWPSGVTWTGCAPGSMSATRMPPGNCPGC